MSQAGIQLSERRLEVVALHRNLTQESMHLYGL
jgi:hypothetical protein